MLAIFLLAVSASGLTIPEVRQEALDRNVRDSIYQNRLYNNLFAHKRGQNRARRGEYEMIRSIMAHLSAGDLTAEQRMTLQQITETPKVQRRRQYNFAPVIDLRKRWF